eukprot:10869613-Alexandrium_andersonii.AAC.1
MCIRDRRRPGPLPRRHPPLLVGPAGRSETAAGVVCRAGDGGRALAEGRPQGCRREARRARCGPCQGLAAPRN